MQRILKHIGNALLIGVLISIILVTILYFNGTLSGEINDIWKEVRNNMIFSIVLYATNSFWYEYYTHNYKKSLFTIRGLIIALLGHIVFTFVGAFIARIILLVGIYDFSFNDFWAQETFLGYGPYMIIGLVVASIFYIVLYYKQRQDKKVKEQKIIAGTASAKFDALKNQLDPHFCSTA